MNDNIYKKMIETSPVAYVQMRVVNNNDNKALYIENANKAYIEMFDIQENIINVNIYDKLKSYQIKIFKEIYMQAINNLNETIVITLLYKKI